MKTKKLSLVIGHLSWVKMAALLRALARAKAFVSLMVGWAVIAVFSPAVHAQAQVAREVIETAVEQVFKQAGSQAARELTEMGGRTAVQEVLEQSSREGGEQLVNKVTQYGIAQGPVALKVIGKSPAKVVEALDGVSPALRSTAIHALERDPQTLMPLLGRYGSSALEVAARHPGVGEGLIEKLGTDGVSLGRQLTTDQSILLARHADEIAQLAQSQRAGVVAQILRSPARVLDYLETHPKVLRTAAGVGLVLAIKSDIIGDGGSSKVLADGRVISTPAHPGFIERILPPSLTFLSTPITVLAGVVGTGMAGWFAIQLFGAWRLQKLRQVVALAGRNVRP